MEHPVFDSAREKMKLFIRQIEKSQETFENSLYTCFKCGSNNIFYVAKQVRSAVFNECHDCHNKWRDGWYSLCNRYLIKIFIVGVARRLRHLYASHRTFLGFNDNVNWVLFGSGKNQAPHTRFRNWNPRGNSFCMYRHACFDFFKKSLVTTSSPSVSTSFSSWIILRSALAFGYQTNMALDCLLKFFGMAI